jgi:hypothetical protein
MHVERDGRLRGLGLGVDAFEVIGAEVFLPNGRGRIAGVARTGTVVTIQELLGDVKLLLVELEGEFGLVLVAHGSGDCLMATGVSSSGCSGA